MIQRLFGRVRQTNVLRARAWLEDYHRWAEAQRKVWTAADFKS